MPKARRRARHSVPAERQARSWRAGAAWAGLWVLMFVALGTARVAHNGSIRASTSGGPALAALIARPLVALFGKAAYLLPFALGAVAVSYLWQAARVNRVRLALRMFASVPVVSVLLAGVQMLGADRGGWGGAVGTFYFLYLQKVLGAWLGLGVGVATAVFFAARLWGVESQLARGFAAVPWRRVLAGAGRFLIDLARRLVTLPHLSRRTPAQASVPETSPWRTPVEGQPVFDPPARSPFQPPPASGPQAPWRGGGAEVRRDPSDETTFRVLPLPAVDAPLPLDLLPDPDPERPELAELQARAPSLQQAIIDIVQRTSGIGLAASGEAFRIGMNAILFEFARRERQTAPICNVERALKDIGLETGRAPVRLEIADAVRIESPSSVGSGASRPSNPCWRKPCAAVKTSAG